MQAKSDTLTAFSDKAEALRVRLGITQAELVRKIGISRSRYYDLKSGKEEASKTMMGRLVSLENKVKTEPPAGTISQLESKSGISSARVMKPQSTPPMPAITSEQIAEYLNNFLDEAGRTPGGLGHAWAMIRLHLDIDSLKRLQKVPPP